MTDNIEDSKNTNDIKSARNIDAKKVSSEILGWLVENVESFIDNHEKIFWINLAVETGESMPESKKMQDLFTQDNMDDESMGDELHELSLKIQSEMMEDSDSLKKLFDRMAFYYEMTGFSNTKGPLIQEMDGNVIIKEFGFDPVPMELIVKQPVMVVKNGEAVETGERRIVKEEKIPPSFMVELEIDIWPRKPVESMY